MSKSITITLPNAVADTLDRHMRTVESSIQDGARASKSNFVSNCIASKFKADGIPIVADEPDTPDVPMEQQPKSGYEPL